MSKVSVASTAVVEETAVIGDGTRVWNFVHVRENARIGKECVLADYVYVGRGVNVGNKVKLENRVDELIKAVERLQQENKTLRASQETLVNERASLIEKTELARNRVESMISRLKSLEDHS